MKCCVPSCPNASNNTVASQEITFHSFPHELHLCAAWLRVLGVEDCCLPDPAFVCSLHFLKDDFYESTTGCKKLQSDAVPSIVHVCIACLDTESRLYSLRRYNMEEAYENLTGILLSEIETFPHTLCLECTQRLSNCYKFRDKSLRGYSFLIDLVKQHELVTMENIKMINRVENKLTSSIVKTVFDPDYSDIYILECSEEDAQIELNRIVDEIASNTQNDTVSDRDSNETVSTFGHAETVSKNTTDVNTLNHDVPTIIKEDDYKIDKGAPIDAQAELEDSVDKVIANIHKFTAVKETNKNTFYCSLANAQTQLSHFVNKVTASYQDDTNIDRATDSIKEYNVYNPVVTCKLGIDCPMEEIIEKTSNYFAAELQTDKTRDATELATNIHHISASIKRKDLKTNDLPPAELKKKLYKIKGKIKDKMTANMYKVNKLNEKAFKGSWAHKKMKSTHFVDTIAANTYGLALMVKKKNSLDHNTAGIKLDKKFTSIICKDTNNFYKAAVAKRVNRNTSDTSFVDVKSNQDQLIKKITDHQYIIKTSGSNNDNPIVNSCNDIKVGKVSTDINQDNSAVNLKSKSFDSSLNIAKMPPAGRFQNIDINKKKPNMIDYPLAKIQKEVHKTVGKVITNVSKETTTDFSLSGTPRTVLFCRESIKDQVENRKCVKKSIKTTHCPVPDVQKELYRVANDVDQVSSNTHKTAVLKGIHKKQSDCFMVKKPTKSVQFSDNMITNIYEDATSINDTMKKLDENVHKVSKNFNSDRMSSQKKLCTEEHLIKSNCPLSNPKTELHEVFNNFNEVTKEVEKVVDKPESPHIVDNITADVQKDDILNEKNVICDEYTLSDIQPKIKVNRIVTCIDELGRTDEILADNRKNKDTSDCSLTGTKRQLDYISKITTNIQHLTNVNVKMAETTNSKLTDNNLNNVFGNVSNNIEINTKNACNIHAKDTNETIGNAQAKLNVKNKYLISNNCSSSKTLTESNRIVDEGSKKKKYSQNNSYPQSAYIINSDSGNDSPDNAYNNDVGTNTLKQFEQVKNATLTQIGYEQKNIVCTKEKNIKINDCADKVQIQRDEFIDECSGIVVQASSNNEHSNKNVYQCVELFTDKTNGDEFNDENEDRNVISPNKIPEVICSLKVNLNHDFQKSNCVSERNSSLGCTQNPGRTRSEKDDHIVCLAVEPTILIGHEKIKKNKNIKRKSQAYKDIKNMSSEIYVKRYLKRLNKATTLSDEILSLPKKRKIRSSIGINTQIKDVSIKNQCFTNNSGMCEMALVQQKIKEDENNVTVPLIQDMKEDSKDITPSVTKKGKLDSSISVLKNQNTDCAGTGTRINNIKCRDVNKNQLTSNTDIKEIFTDGNKSKIQPAKYKNNIKTPDINRQKKDLLESQLFCDRNIRRPASVGTYNFKEIKIMINTKAPFDLNDKTGKILFGNKLHRNAISKKCSSRSFESKTKKLYSDHSLNATDLNNTVKNNEERIDHLENPSSCDPMIIKNNNSRSYLREEKKTKTNAVMKRINSDKGNKECGVTLKLSSSISSEESADTHINQSKTEKIKTADPKVNINYECNVNPLCHISNTIIAKENKSKTNIVKYTGIITVTNNESQNDLVNRIPSHIFRDTAKSFDLNTFKSKRSITAVTTDAISNGEGVELQNQISNINNDVGQRNGTDINNINRECKPLLQNKKHCGNKIIESNHLDTSHVKKYLTNCSKVTKDRIKKHIDCKDVLKKTLSCDVCDYETDRKKYMESHVLLHTGEKDAKKIYPCTHCKYKTKNRHHLEYHLRTHTGEKPFNCSFCEHKFARKTNLVNHMRTHTGEKPFSCKFCNYRCTDSSNLKTHMRTHTKEKPFSCKYCNYTSIQSSTLVSHMRRHTGEKPFACDLCHKKFSGKGNLIKHQRTHLDIRPFVCKICQNKFSQKSNLLRHLKIHTA